MAKTNPPAPPVTEAPADAPEFRTGRVHSESRRYDHAHGQQVVEGNKEFVSFLEEVADEDAVAMLDDPKAVRAYMDLVEQRGYVLASKPYRLVGGAAAAAAARPVVAR